MFKKKRILFLLATSALLAACGGGSSDNTPAATTGNGNTLPTGGGGTSGSTSGSTSGTSTPTGNSSGGGTSTAGSSGSTSGNTSGSTSGSGGTTTGGTTSGTTTPVVVDQKLQGHLEVVANQVVYIRTNRVIYLPVTLSQLESDSGLVDVASGSPTAHVDIDTVAAHCDPAIDGRCGIQPTAAAPAAPLAAFGLRIEKYVIPSTQGQAVGNQKVVGRIAVDLTERKDSPGISAGESPEIMRFVIDKVEMTTNENGELVSLKLQDGAQIHVYGRSASGAEIRENIPAPSNTVRILPMSEVPDNHGDTSSFFLLLDLEAGFSQAGQKLAALQNIAGHFAMRVTLSSVQQIIRPAAAATAEYPAVETKELVGQSITVNDQPAVTGAGLVGNTWIRMYPPQSH